MGRFHLLLHLGRRLPSLPQPLLPLVAVQLPLPSPAVNCLTLMWTSVVLAEC